MACSEATREPLRESTKPPLTSRIGISASTSACQFRTSGINTSRNCIKPGSHARGAVRALGCYASGSRLGGVVISGWSVQHNHSIHDSRLRLAGLRYGCYLYFRCSL